MIKRINGVDIDITRYIDLFKTAYECLANRKSLGTNTNILEVEKYRKVYKYIEAYDELNNMLPFPLNSLDIDSKYSYIATIMKDKFMEPFSMWIDNALFIKIDDIVIKFTGIIYEIVDDYTVLDDNTNIELYTKELGYREFVWAIKTVMNNKSLNEYYSIFLSDILNACKDILILQRELKSILEFSNVPDKKYFKDDLILDVKRNTYFMVDVYNAGKEYTDENEYTIKRDGSIAVSKKYIEIYNYNLLQKFENKGFVKRDIDGFTGVFEIIAGKLSINKDKQIIYKGIIINGLIVFTVNNELYMCTLNKYSKPIRIASNIELYSYNENCVYFTYKNNNKIESIYKFNSIDKRLSLCNIWMGGDK